MKWTDRLFRAFQAKAPDRPQPGPLLFPRREDAAREYPGAGLTPSGLAAILREADAGSLSSSMQLFEEMEEKDAHLFAVASTRRFALTGLEWRIVSAADVQPQADRALAEDAAAYCREVLADLDGFDEAVQHLSLALGRNIALAEIIWDEVDGALRPVDLAPVDFTRIVFDELDRPRILTELEPMAGVAPPLAKFIIHTPHSVSGHPQRGGLLRVTAMVYLAKNLALKDWMIFSEVFGMPVRIARYDPQATAEEKRELLRMLEELGAHAAGIFSRGVELQLVEAGRGGSKPPYEALINLLNREISKAWLGQTLTTDISGQSGSIAAARTHETVRQDLLADDIRKEGRTIRRDLLGPLVAFRFGPDAPVPFFRRRRGAVDDPGGLIDLMDAATNRLGLSIPKRWAHDALNLPMASEQEKAVPGRRSG